MKPVKWFSKGQIGMMEMIMVMVVVMVLLAVGLVFYFKFSISSLQEKGEDISEDKAAVIVSTVFQLPEIECTYLGSRVSNACVDTLKLLILSTKDKKENPDFIEHRRHYSGLYGYKTIVFEQLYPEAKEEDCTVEIFANPNYPELGREMSCGKWTIYDNPKQGVEPTFRTMPIALYYPSKNVYAFGLMKIYNY